MREPRPEDCTDIIDPALALGAVLLAPAGYLAKEEQRLRDQSNRAEHRQLEDEHDVRAVRVPEEMGPLQCFAPGQAVDFIPAASSQEEPDALDDRRRRQVGVVVPVVVPVQYGA